jgi:hypothetical protein
MAKSVEAHFGITVDEKRSSCWRVRAGAHRPELFIEREHPGPSFHVSLHESGHWHMKVRDEVVREWLRPDEFHPGYTRAMVIVQPIAVATLIVAPHEDAVLVDLAGDGDIPALFSIFIERPGADPEGWPGRTAMGTELIARLELAADAGTACIVLERARYEPKSTHTFGGATDDQLADMLRVAAEGELYTTLFGDHEGALLAYDARFKPAS